MAQNQKRREKGTGNIYKRDNGSWVGRLNIGIKPDGKPKIKCFSGKTEAEVKRKIREYNAGGFVVEKQKISVETYFMNWLRVYKKDHLKSSSYDRLENTIIHQIIPNIGMIQLQQLTSDDIQILLSKLKTDGYSHSIVKKTYDCIGAVLKHALIKGDIDKNPMLLIKPPEKRSFPQKEIRFFTEEEVTLIIEECGREYSTGTPVYVYGDAFILMLNTGIRIGELIALEKGDWNEEEKTLHIKRNIQLIKSRDEDGNPVSGCELAYNTTKTYSGNRVIPLNQNATNALRRLCDAHPKSNYVVCSANETLIPPQRIERTFYRILKNIGLNKTGIHSLRHTFASMLFAKKVDIKTVSKLLGHASIQITLNTYIHLIENADHDAVAVLDNIF
ncbi:MAG: site-specific integrase [Bacteroidales bacterium]|nr:site-specific integrase [Bacteroidales bacterium]